MGIEQSVHDVSELSNVVVVQLFDNSCRIGIDITNMDKSFCVCAKAFEILEIGGMCVLLRVFFFLMFRGEDPIFS